MATDLVLIPGPVLNDVLTGQGYHALNGEERVGRRRVSAWGITGVYDAASGELRADAVDDALATAMVAAGRATAR